MPKPYRIRAESFACHTSVCADFKRAADVSRLSNRRTHEDNAVLMNTDLNLNSTCPEVSLSNPTPSKPLTNSSAAMRPPARPDAVSKISDQTNQLRIIEQNYLNAIAHQPSNELDMLSQRLDYALNTLVLAQPNPSEHDLMVIRGLTDTLSRLRPNDENLGTLGSIVSKYSDCNHPDIQKLKDAYATFFR